MSSSFADHIAKAVLQVTKPWAEIKKREDREQRHFAAYLRKIYTRKHTSRITIKDAAFEVIPEAYKKASGDGTYPANARQIMYAARPAVQDKTGRQLDDDYFTQTLLPEYVREHAEAQTWDIIYDARGHLREPHNGVAIGIGTVEVREYLDALPGAGEEAGGGPGYHYGTMLFVEKEGFLPLLESARIPQRYDLAIASSKGLSSTAARDLIAALSGRVKILVLHDFDKAGFSIVGTLQRDTPRYTFESIPEIIDLGLRLKDVEEWKLQTEKAYYRGGSPEENLRLNGATQEEVEFLRDQRVELNAFMSKDFVAWLEGKLIEAGVEKVIPDDTVIERRYFNARTSRLLGRLRKSLWQEFWKEHANEVQEIQAKFAKLKAEMKKVRVPKDLRRRVAAHLKKNREVLWDMALARVESEEPESGKRRQELRSDAD